MCLCGFLVSCPCLMSSCVVSLSHVLVSCALVLPSSSCLAVMLMSISRVCVSPMHMHTKRCLVCHTEAHARERDRHTDERETNLVDGFELG